MPRRLISLSISVYLSVLIFAQEPTKVFSRDSLSQEYLSALKKNFGTHKTYPSQYEEQILIALSYYPELEKVPIHFRIKKKHTPLSTRSSWAGLLKEENRRDYVITISSNTEEMLTPILFENLPFNAQIGVIGHELGHVIEFMSMPTFNIMEHAANNVSSKYIDHFEFMTDSICIGHGLGYQLLAWSTYVRQVMHKENWDGADNVHKPMMKERYMNPSTIRKRINQLPLYHSASG
jgi:hypothetical protein